MNLDPHLHCTLTHDHRPIALAQFCIYFISPSAFITTHISRGSAVPADWGLFNWAVCGLRWRNTPSARALWYANSQGEGPWSWESPGPLSFPADQRLQHHKVDSLCFWQIALTVDLKNVVVSRCWFQIILCYRGLKELERDSSSMEKRFAYKFLKKLLKYVDSAQEFIAHLGTLTLRRAMRELKQVFLTSKCVFLCSDCRVHGCHWQNRQVSSWTRNQVFCQSKNNACHTHQFLGISLNFSLNQSY